MQTRPIYKGRIIDLSLESVQLPNGARCELEIVRHPGGAATVAIDRQNRVCLLRQFRHAAGGWIWELPAGRLDPGEEPLATAQRELKEEAGILAHQWDDLGSLISSPAVFTEVIHLYLARELTHTERQTEAHEVIEVHWLAYADALDWARAGEIRDAKTLIGLFRAQSVVGQA